MVSEGAQKNFKKFTLRLNVRKGFIPDEAYYRRLIAKAILFRQTEKLVQQQKYGGYRANIVTYTIAWLSHATEMRIDLERIWKEQQLSAALQDEIVIVSQFVHHLITNPPGAANITEWCKKESCWDKVREYQHTISGVLKKDSAVYTFSLVNDYVSPQERKSFKDDQCFFQVRFSLRSELGFSALPDEQRITQDEDFQSNQMLYRDVKNYAQGHGCSTGWDAVDGVVHEIHTEIFPEYEIDWIDGLKRRVAGLPDQQTALRHIGACEDCLYRIREGVQLLGSDQRIRTAFQYMNRAMLLFL